MAPPLIRLEKHHLILPQPRPAAHRNSSAVIFFAATSLSADESCAGRGGWRVDQFQADWFFALIEINLRDNSVLPGGEVEGELRADLDRLLVDPDFQAG